MKVGEQHLQQYIKVQLLQHTLDSNNPTNKRRRCPNAEKNEKKSHLFLRKTHDDNKIKMMLVRYENVREKEKNEDAVENKQITLSQAVNSKIHNAVEKDIDFGTCFIL